MYLCNALTWLYTVRITLVFLSMCVTHSEFILTVISVVPYFQKGDIITREMEKLYPSQHFV